MASYQQEFLQRVADRDAVVGIIGLGYVGLPLVMRFADCGYPVLGFDIDNSKIDKIEQNQSYIKHIDGADIAKAKQQGFTATSDFTKITSVDVIILCVPTPLDKHREPDLSYIVSTIDCILPYLRKGQLLSLESTTYPGTTDEVIMPKIESQGFSIGEDYFLVYSPEREDPGNEKFDTQTIPKICGGVSEACLELGVAIYSAAIDEVVPVSSTKVAEMTKLLENIHRAVNIGLVNEMKIVADRMGINIHDVIDAAKTKPFGFTAFYPGPGLGGHCIPIDPFYLTWKAREFDINTRFIELAGEVNTAMPNWVIAKVVDALNEHEKALKNAKILVLGIAYKKNIDDMRESPSVEIMEILQEKGAQLAYSDPYVPVFPKMREHHFDLSSVPLSPTDVSQYDCVILATDHDDFDYQMLMDNARLLVDTRGRYAKLSKANIIPA